MTNIQQPHFLLEMLLFHVIILDDYVAQMF